MLRALASRMLSACAWNSLVRCPYRYCPNPSTTPQHELEETAAQRAAVAARAKTRAQIEAAAARATVPPTVAVEPRGQPLGPGGRGRAPGKPKAPQQPEQFAEGEGEGQLEAQHGEEQAGGEADRGDEPATLDAAPAASKRARASDGHLVTKTPFIVEEPSRPGPPGQPGGDPAAVPRASQPLKRKATEPASAAAAAAPARAEAWVADPSGGGSGAGSEDGTPSDSECTPYDRRRADSVIKARQQALEQKKRRAAAAAKDASAMPPPATAGQQGRAVAGQQRQRPAGGSTQTQSQQPRANSKPGAAVPRAGRLASMSMRCAGSLGSLWAYGWQLLQGGLESARACGTPALHRLPQRPSHPCPPACPHPHPQH
jgi:hypothetical protein